MYERTPRIKIIFKIPDGAWNREASKVARELFHGENPYLMVPCAIRNFENGLVSLPHLTARALILKNI